MEARKRTDKGREAVPAEGVSSHDAAPPLAGPQLRYIRKALTILHDGPAQKEDERRRQAWGDVHQSVKPFSSALELSDNVKDAVNSFVIDRLPALKKKIPSIEEFSDDQLLAALVNNWLSENIPDVEGQRREVLIAVMAHVVKRIETTCYRKILENATPDQLETLGIDERLRDIVIDLLETSLKTDPLFIRFLAYSQLSGDVSENASATSLHLPDDRRKRHTLAELFPHETQFLSAHLTKTARSNPDLFMQYSGGAAFQKYLSALSDFYGAKNTRQARAAHEVVRRLHRQVVREGFPIVLTPPAEGYYKEPYVDPELVVSLRTKDAQEEDERFAHLRGVYAATLLEFGVGQFSDRMREQSIRSVVVLGAYGVNTVFRAVAQEDPILMYLDEQIRVYDRDFPEFLQTLISNTKDEFPKDVSLQERMSRTNTILHELSHSVFPTKNEKGDTTKEGERFGPEAASIIDEVKAEILYHAFIPEMLTKGGLEGTKEQWAVASLGSSLQSLRDSPPGDPYYHNAVYALNDLINQGTITFDGKQVTIMNYDGYYSSLKKCSQELLSLHTDTSMNEKKARSWVKKRCVPNDALKPLEEFLKAA